MLFWCDNNNLRATKLLTSIIANNVFKSLFKFGNTSVDACGIDVSSNNFAQPKTQW
jgi:hypothetical protein